MNLFTFRKCLLFLGILFFARITTAQDFITTWQTTTPNESITIPTSPFTSGYNYSVDWGDGSPLETGITGDATHVYVNPGIHTVRVSGAFPRIYFNSTGDRFKIRTIEQWGNIAWQSMALAFWGCTNLKINASDAPDLSLVTSMELMLANTSEFNQSINHWDVSNIQNMRALFNAAENFNQPLDSWNVSNVTNMDGMFSDAESFNKSLANWNISQVISMGGIFDNCGLSVSNYDTTLGGWAAQNVKNNVFISAINLSFCNADNARNTLINTFGWTFFGDIQNCFAALLDCNPSKDFTTLREFYNVTNGDSWTNNSNWNSANPLDTWFGVTTNAEGCVTELRLPNNNLTSTEFPDSLAILRKVQVIDLSNNNLAGSISSLFASGGAGIEAIRPKFGVSNGGRFENVPEVQVFSQNGTGFEPEVGNYGFHPCNSCRS